MPTGSLPKALKDAGRVEDFRDIFCAHVQYLEDGVQKHIRGPWRPEKAQAQKDLEDMRACGSLFGEDRVKGLEAMKAEARRIQERAAHDREIRHAMLLRGPSGFDSDASDNFDLDIEDPDEWWQELQDGKVPKTVIQPKKPITNATEATVALIKFRPLHEDAAELQRILDLRADANATLPDSKICPMDNILTFAPADKIAVMRQLLMDHGATETEEDKKYWKLHQLNDAYEYRRLQAFYEDYRHLSPIGCAKEL